MDSFYGLQTDKAVITKKNPSNSRDRYNQIKTTYSQGFNANSVFVFSDASVHSIGTVILHVFPDGNEKVIAHTYHTYPHNSKLQPD